MHCTVGDLKAIRFADRSVIEPFGCLGHILVGIVHRVQNPVGARFKDHVGQRLCAKGAAGSEVCQRR